MSRIAAPSPASRSPCSTAASAVKNSPPSENESGVTFTIPITRGRGRSARSEVQSARRVAGGRDRVRRRHERRLRRARLAELRDVDARLLRDDGEDLLAVEDL